MPRNGDDVVPFSYTFDKKRKVQLCLQTEMEKSVKPNKSLSFCIVVEHLTKTVRFTTIATPVCRIVECERDIQQLYESLYCMSICANVDKYTHLPFFFVNILINVIFFL